MMFQNAIGLLGLVALPTILVLHFFRSQVREIRIGGLHLWEFARRHQPAGRTWQKFHTSVPLLLELLAALLLTLLLSGFTWLRAHEGRHAIVVLDASVSMLARDDAGRSGADKARAWIERHLDDTTRWTVITAGLDAGILAGPFATSEQVRSRLSVWRPEAPAAALVEAVRFATRFGEPDQAVLLISDTGIDPETAGGTLEQLTVGTARSNAAIVFADRFRKDATTDRVVAIVRRFGGTEPVTLTLRAAGADVAHKEIAPDAAKATKVEFEIELLDEPIALHLDDDPLALDNVVRLAPTPPRRVLACVRTRDALTDYARRALEAATETYLVDDPEEAHLLVTDSPSGVPGPRTLTVLRLAPKPSADFVGVAAREFLPDRSNPLVDGLTYEGLLWGYDTRRRATADEALLLRAGPVPLVVQRPDEGRAAVYFHNLLPEHGNVARTTVWPLLLYNAAEMTRERLPGLRRTNFRTGESIDPGVGELGTAAQSWQLDGPHGTTPLAAVPPAFDSLPPGLYRLAATTADGRALGFRFAVNLFAPEESDLTRHNSDRTTAFARLVTTRAERESFNPVAYYLLLTALAAALAALWVWQTRRHD